MAGLDGGLADISVAGLRSSPAKATSTIKFGNSLSVSDTSFNVSNISVYDSLGVKHQMTLALTNNNSTSSGSWTFTLSEGSSTIKTGEIRYSGSGLPQPGYETTTFVFTPANGASPKVVTLDFSGSNQFSSTSSSLSVSSQDGYAAGYLTKTTFDEDGYLALTYSNGQTAKGQRLALAWFDNLTALESQGNNRFAQVGTSQRILSSPGDSSMGKLKLNGVELSNVDLSKEFSELIIVQRGYQASSQVISAANEMIQQLGELQGKR